MAVSLASFRDRFPEFSDPAEYPDSRIQMLLDDAALVHMGLDEARWGGCYDYAQAYLVAHLLSGMRISEGGDTTSTQGTISQKTVGSVSVTRSVVAKERSDQDDSLVGTTYGQQFINLRNLLFPGVLAVTP